MNKFFKIFDAFIVGIIWGIISLGGLFFAVPPKYHSRNIFILIFIYFFLMSSVISYNV